MSLGLPVELLKSFIFADIFSNNNRGRGHQNIKIPDCGCKAVWLFNSVAFHLVDLEISSGAAFTSTGVTFY